LSGPRDLRGGPDEPQLIPLRFLRAIAVEHLHATVPAVCRIEYGPALIFAARNLPALAFLDFDFLLLLAASGGFGG
jgi:hypothetical protein